jgi:hypothetical protein
MTLVHEALGINHLTDGELGIEIEVEGNNLPEDTPKGWMREHDGSLRGESAEYVLSEPLSHGDAMDAVDRLEEKFKQAGSKVKDSVRAGVHVHVNVQHLTDLELINFITCYLILEDLLVKFCGEDREGNLFCLRLKDAEYPLFSLIQGIKLRSVHGGYFNNDDLRYSSMNLKALATYGSLEFRSMRTGTDFQRIKDWATILYDLRERSREFANPRQIIEIFSGDMVDGFVRKVVGNHAKKLLCDGYEDMLVEGMRRAQDIAYCAEWEDWSFKAPGVFHAAQERREIDDIRRMAEMLNEAAVPQPMKIVMDEPMEDV